MIFILFNFTFPRFLKDFIKLFRLFDCFQSTLILDLLFFPLFLPFSNFISDFFPIRFSFLTFLLFKAFFDFNFFQSICLYFLLILFFFLLKFFDKFLLTFNDFSYFLFFFFRHLRSKHSVRIETRLRLGKSAWWEADSWFIDVEFIFLKLKLFKLILDLLLFTDQLWQLHFIFWSLVFILFHFESFLNK